MPPKPLKYASRYKREDDNEGDNDAILLSQAEKGDPALCMVFTMPNDDDYSEEDMDRAKADREKIMSQIKTLGFETDVMLNVAQDKIFLRITLGKDVLRRLAESRKIKMILDKGDAAGVRIPYRPDYEESKLFKEPEDERPVFSSLQQLEMADSLLRSEPFSDGTDGIEQIVPERLMQEDVPQAEGEQREKPLKRIIGYFYLHEPLLGFRGRLAERWAGRIYEPQPIQLINHYFGEKIAMHFAWLGYYISMLWLPSALGIILTVVEGEESPYYLIFCMALVVWSTVFISLWKLYEARLMYDFDTVEFENSEELRLEYMDHLQTQKGTHINEITGEPDEYYMDNGTFFPPAGRRGRIAKSYLLVFAFCLAVIVLDIAIYALIARPLMAPDNVTAGSVVCGLLFALSSLGLEYAFDSRFEQFVLDENWPTDTQHEDASILRSCPFRIVCNYFGPFFIAAVANHFALGGGDYSCPDRLCFPVVRVVIMVQYVTLLAAHQAREHVVPRIVEAYASFKGSGKKKAAKGGKLIKLPMEEQLEFQDYEGVSSAYGTFVYQFGWVALFASTFPLMPALALACNLFELRMDAHSLLLQTKRPRYQGARDIGSWQDVLTVIGLLAILTNSVLVGLTSHTLYFYMPRLSEVDRLWCVALLEHALFLLRLLVLQFLPQRGDADRQRYERRLFQAQATLDQYDKHA